MMMLIGLPKTLPPKSSIAICAAVTEPCPVGVDAGPFMSVRTPILTTSSDTWASAAVDSSNAAKVASAKRVLAGMSCLLLLVRRIGRILIGSLLRLFIAMRQLTAPPAGRHARRTGNWLYISDFIQVIDAA